MEYLLIRTAGLRYPGPAGRFAPSGSGRRPRWGVPRIADHDMPVRVRGRASSTLADPQRRSYGIQGSDLLATAPESDGFRRCRTPVRMSAKRRGRCEKTIAVNHWAICCRCAGLRHCKDFACNILSAIGLLVFLGAVTFHTASVYLWGRRRDPANGRNRRISSLPSSRGGSLD